MNAIILFKIFLFAHFLNSSTYSCICRLHMDACVCIWFNGHIRNIETYIENGIFFFCWCGGGGGSGAVLWPKNKTCGSPAVIHTCCNIPSDYSDMMCFVLFVTNIAIHSTISAFGMLIHRGTKWDRIHALPMLCSTQFYWLENESENKNRDLHFLHVLHFRFAIAEEMKMWN